MALTDAPAGDSAPALLPRHSSLGSQNGVEAVLFVADAPVSLDRIADAVGCTPEAAAQVVDALSRDYADRGLRVQRHGNLVQIVTAAEAAPAVERFLGLDAGARLSPAALETLAVVAYRQPVTRAQVEAIRGVNADRAIATLQARGLVEEVGRLDAVGRPALFGTTAEFLEHFGVESIDALPPVPEPDRDGST